MPPRDEKTGHQMGKKPDAYQALGLSRAKFLAAAHTKFKEFGLIPDMYSGLAADADHMVTAVAARKDTVAAYVASQAEIDSYVLRRWDAFGDKFPPCPERGVLVPDVPDIQMQQMSAGEIFARGRKHKPETIAYENAVSMPFDHLYPAVLTGVDVRTRQLIVLGSVLYDQTKGFTRLGSVKSAATRPGKTSRKPSDNLAL